MTECKPGIGIVNSLLPVIDGILGIRDAIGAVIEPVYFLTRTWYSDSGRTSQATAPEGYAKDSVTQLKPTPMMKNFSQDIRLREGGSVKAGDIILKSVSKNLFKESDLDGSSSARNVEKFYVIGSKVYQVINVTENYVTWDVQVRELSNQTRY